MSGVHRFLSKRDKSQTRKHHGKSNPDTLQKAIDPSSALDFFGIFQNAAKPTSGEETKLKAIRQKLLTSKGVVVRDGAILWALRSQIGNEDVDASHAFLLAASDASEGLVGNYDSSIKLQGAQNRKAVTCFLDSTLFSMFSRLDSFEAMLYNDFDDLPRKKLSFLLRLWVNLLRSGQLITTDITQQIQEALAACGWDDARECHQQDASEAFTFITSKLELPLLTLKMDIYHTGREDAADDHKFINERLLDVAIPEDPRGEKTEITLEDCLEDYFNNRIEVKRYLERRSTINSGKVPGGEEKGSALHVETVEVDTDSSPSTPYSSSPMKESPLRPNYRTRGTSIIQERYFPPPPPYETPNPLSNVSTTTSNRSRAGSVRKEVMMPAWQFFSLIPWYTDNAPSNDSSVAAHFSSKRPVLGLCLKRYAMRNGRPVRLNTKIDIPVEIGLPHFIQDDHMQKDGAIYGNFKLSLQSVVCHRGNSVDSGHYISLARGSSVQSSSTDNLSAESKVWLRFDDLAQPRVTRVDIEKALEEETPYLLFYQIVPMEGDPGQITAGERSSSPTTVGSNIAADESHLTAPRPLASPAISSGRQSFDLGVKEEPRGRVPAEGRRLSGISFADLGSARKELADSMSPTRTPASRRGSSDLSRIQSRASDGISAAFARFAGRKSRDDLTTDTNVAEVLVREVSKESGTPGPNGQSPLPPIPTSNPPPPPQQQSPQQQQQQHGHHAPHTHAHLGVPIVGKSHKRDKSKSRLVKNSKGKEHDPDRECVVM